MGNFGDKMRMGPDAVAVKLACGKCGTLVASGQPCPKCGPAVESKPLPPEDKPDGRSDP